MPAERQSEDATTARRERRYNPSAATNANAAVDDVSPAQIASQPEPRPRRDRTSRLTRLPSAVEALLPFLPPFGMPGTAQYRAPPSTYSSRPRPTQTSSTSLLPSALVGETWNPFDLPEVALEEPAPSPSTGWEHSDSDEAPVGWAFLSMARLMLLQPSSSLPGTTPGSGTSYVHTVSNEEDEEDDDDERDDGDKENSQPTDGLPYPSSPPKDAAVALVPPTPAGAKAYPRFPTEMELSPNKTELEYLRMARSEWDSDYEDLAPPSTSVEAPVVLYRDPMASSDGQVAGAIAQDATGNASASVTHSASQNQNAAAANTMKPSKSLVLRDATLDHVPMTGLARELYIMESQTVGLETSIADDSSAA